MIDIIKFTSDKKNAWNQVVTQAKNGHFMFSRDYMEYHSDRFVDYSLLFYEGHELVALLPASKHGDTLISHGGLTFGGLILSKKIKAIQVIDIFSGLKTYLKEQNFTKIRYKAIPYIYNELPAEEDLYALFVNDATLIRRDISSTIFSENKLGFSGGKKNGLAKAKKHGVSVNNSNNFKDFHTMLNTVLTEKHDTQPTHSAEEIILLSNRFPENIQLFGAFYNNTMVAGALMYVTNSVAHTQYLATSEQGREIGALDSLLHVLINETYASKRFFDFGISTEEQGRYLNTGLISQKEMFGARAVVYDTYELLMH